MLAAFDFWILSFSAITVIATIWMGFWAARKSRTASDFFVAGRGVSVGWNASAISGEYLSAASFMGIAGMVMSSGYDALWYPVCYACGYLFLLLFIAGPLRRFGAYTIPDFAEGRYDSPLFRKIAVIFVLFIGFFYTMPQMKGAGTTLSYIFQDISWFGQKGLPYPIGVVIVGAVITFNVALGGMKGITLVQAFQYWLKMFAISVPVFVLMSVYGGYGKQLAREAQAQPRIQPTAARSALPLPATTGPESSLLNGPSKVEVSLDYTARPPGQLSAPAWPPIQPTSMAPRWLREKVIHRDQGTFNRLGRHYRSLRARWASFVPPSAGVPMELIAQIYPEFLYPPKTEFTFYYSPGLSPSSALIRPITNSPGATASSGPQSIRDLLAANGYTLVHLRSDAVKIFPTAEAARYAAETPDLVLENGAAFSEADEAQQPEISMDPGGAVRLPLPAKAPPDPAWLNPFGPLTTKAAKAARGTVTSKVPLESIDADPSRRTGILPAFITEPLNERLETVRFAGNPVPWPDLLLHLTGDRPFRRFEWNRGVTNTPITWPTTQALKIPEFYDLLPRVLATNGITLVFDHETIRLFPSKDRVEQPIDPRPYALLYTYSLIIALVCGTADLPHILVRFYTNPDGVAAKRTTMWVMILIGVFYLFPPIFGVMGRNLMPALYEGTGSKGTDKVVLELPRVLDTGGPAPGIAVPNAANGTVGRLDPQTSHSPWGSILSGITCAGAFAAFMSTFSGLLVSMTGALAHDVYGRILRPQSTPADRMRMFKWCAALVGGVATVLGCFVEPLEINFMVGQAFAIAAASYFPLLFMSVWWRGMTLQGAATGMLSGGLCALLAVALTNASNLALDKGPMGQVFAAFKPLNAFWAEHPAPHPV